MTFVQRVGGASVQCMRCTSVYVRDKMNCLLSLALLLVAGNVVAVGEPIKEQHSSHTNNWAVLVN